MAANATTSPLATLKYGAANVAPQLELVVDYIANASTWSILATLLALAVVYDQCMSRPQKRNRDGERGSGGTGDTC